MFLKNLNPHNERELDLFFQLSREHILALVNKGRFNIAADLAQGYSKFIIEEGQKFNFLITLNELYLELRFLQAVANYNLKNYKVSTAIFKSLLLHDKKNELYQKWFRLSAFGKNMFVLNVAAGICGVFILSTIFFKQYVPNPLLRITILSIGTIDLIGLITYERYAKRSMRKKAM